jgi:hypothetical protein
VLTRTAEVHAQAWKATFDGYLRERAERDVVGVDRAGQAEALLAHGTSIVVRDLAELLDDA